MIAMYVSAAIALVTTGEAIGIVAMVPGHLPSSAGYRVIGGGREAVRTVIPFDPQAVPRVGEDQVPVACRAARLPGRLPRPGARCIVSRVPCSSAHDGASRSRAGDLRPAAAAGRDQARASHHYYRRRQRAGTALSLACPREPGQRHKSVPHGLWRHSIAGSWHQVDISR